LINLKEKKGLIDKKELLEEIRMPLTVIKYGMIGL
jgi:hypothetical protein